MLMAHLFDQYADLSLMNKNIMVFDENIISYSSAFKVISDKK